MNLETQAQFAGLGAPQRGEPPTIHKLEHSPGERWLMGLLGSVALLGCMSLGALLLSVFVVHHRGVPEPLPTKLVLGLLGLFFLWLASYGGRLVARAIRGYRPVGGPVDRFAFWSARNPHLFTLLVVGGSTALSFGPGIGWVGRWFLLVPLGGLLAVALHELGHVAGAALAGVRPELVLIGPFSFDGRGASWKLGWNASELSAVFLPEMPRAAPVWKKALVIALGPLASLRPEGARRLFPEHRERLRGRS